VSKELKYFLEHKHIEHTHSAPYYPMTQGKIERYQPLDEEHREPAKLFSSGKS